MAVLMSTKDFVWHKDTKTFSCDITDIELLRSSPIQKSIDLKSHHTGKIRNFKYVSSIRDSENDIVGWQYRSDAIDANGSFNMIIYND